MEAVVIGNGIAGIEAALTIRAREPDWDVTIVSEESDHFFSRTALMWVVTGQLSHRCIEPHERDLYERLRFRRVRERAVGVDLAGKTVALAGGEKLSYDRLVIACGSRPRPSPWPGAELEGVGHFVTLQDLEWLEHELHGGASRGGPPPNADAHLARTTEDSPYRRRPSRWAARGGPPKYPVVIGGGLIGIEAVEVMVAMGSSPRFFVREEHFWPIALDAREGAWISEALAAHGVQMHLGENVQELRGDGAITHVLGERGEVPCDLCVVAIGVVPNTEWLKTSGLELDPRGGGIVVDASQRTSDPHVFAAGDCASVTWFDGTRRPEPLWYTGKAQGRVAGRAALGDPARYDRHVWFNSAKLMDVEYTTAGLVNLHVEDEREWFFEERGAVRSTLRIVLSGERVVGFNALGRRWDHSVWIRWIEERRGLSYVLAHLDDARFDTELVPPLRIPSEARAKAPTPTTSERPAVSAPLY
ncbi:MAG: FAD-dependent oxidoreductase [Sandaracinus sp.]|nr:FAD-dependent oxidoreductase [Sandaracinus sp.]